jgi:2-polyprenyl-3-methyl-5-hydroxy-6-metoxy-1,4-benzoquinol methylase
MNSSSRRDPPPLLGTPIRILDGPAGPIPSYVTSQDANLDRATVEGFGHEWQRFDEFTDEEVHRGGQEYFGDLLTDRMLDGARVLDVGCGSGRWARYLAARAACVDAVDPSQAALVAARTTAALPNVRVVQASVSSLPYAEGSFDLVASVGVLHHVPDTLDAIRRLARLVRPGGWLYLYLYYRLEGRSAAYRAAFHASNALRAVVSRMPARLKTAAAELAAVTLYLPCILAAATVKKVAPTRSWYEQIPLHYYVGRPWKVVRNDALDRFGTPIERRFNRAEITAMLEAAGLTGVTFGDAMPRWRVIARRP